MSLETIRARDPVAAWSIARTLPLEGGLVDNPHDPGGITDFGLSLRWALAEVAAHPEELALLDVDHDGDVDRQDIRGLTADAAADLYYSTWWRRGFYWRLQPPIVGWKAFDIAVNTGPRRAGLILQQSLVAIGLGVTVDGAVGPQTFQAVAGENARDQGHALLSAMRDQQAAFYRGLAAAKPELGIFLTGWLNRASA